MTYKLTILRKPTYLHAVVTGWNTRENVEQHMEEIMRECAARRCFRVLVEERLDGHRLDPLDVYKLASAGASRFSGMLEAMAYVDVNARGDTMKFAADVAAIRSFPVAVFATVAEAEKWLLAEAGKPSPDNP